MSARLIHFRCVDPAHLSAGVYPGGLVTHHQGYWAYCNDPLARGAHRWQATGGVDVELLRIEQRGRLNVRARARLAQDA